MLKRIVTLCLMAALALPMAVAQDDDAALSAAALRDKGLNAQNMGLTELAERYYRRALESAEGDPSGETQRLLGILLE